MSRLRDAAFVVVFGVIALVSMLLAPTDDIARTAAYVLFVETPIVVLLAIAAHGYIEWSSHR